MEPEFYHKNIFGEVIDIAPQAEDEVNIGPAKKSDFNILSLTDAIGARDKKHAWILYEKALASGLAPEEIFWKVVWQVKVMILAARTSTAEEAGLNPFVYKKAKSNLKHFQPKELESLSEKLVIGYHEVRRGGEEIETFIEKLLLSL